MTAAERLAQWCDAVEFAHEECCLCRTIRPKATCSAMQGARIVRAMLAAAEKEERDERETRARVGATFCSGAIVHAGAAALEEP